MALLFIEAFLLELNPAPQPVVSSADVSQLIERRHLDEINGFDKIRRKMYDPNEDDDFHRVVASESVLGLAIDDLDSWIKELRSASGRVHEDLRHRIGTRRSLSALLNRFRVRCEWHDRDRLRKIATDSSTPEDSLAAEFARWLFDQGYSPITKPYTGGLQPDLLDPARLYVEAKRYKRPARSYIKQGAHQLHDTVMRLVGTPYEIREALFVVFREAGPRYVLPERVKGEEWDMLPMLIDIAPLAESGSQQAHQPRMITETELGAAMRKEGLDQGDPDE